MSIEKYLDYAHWKVADTSEKVFAGALTLSSALELAQVLVHVYRKGAGDAEILRCMIYTDADFTRLVARSASFILTDLASGTNIRGIVPLDFTTNSVTGKSTFLNAGKTYYFTLELSNYTRDANDFYVAYLVDNVAPIYVSAELPTLYMPLIGYQIREHRDL